MNLMWGSILSACALGVIAFNKIESVDRVNAVVIPMVLAAVGVLASIIGSLLVKTGESTKQNVLLGALRRGTNTSAILIAIVAFPLVWLVLGKEFIGFYLAILAGLLAGVLIGFFTEYFTSDTYKPTQDLADKSVTGSATIIIGGLSLGMLSTALPILIVVICVMAAYVCSGGFIEATRGLYGIALSAVGMLSHSGDHSCLRIAYGPIADNAGGIAEMAGLDPEVRVRTDASGFSGKYYSGNRKRLCHRFCGSDSAGSDRFLRGKGTGSWR